MVDPMDIVLAKTKEISWSWSSGPYKLASGEDLSTLKHKEEKRRDWSFRIQDGKTWKRELKSQRRDLINEKVLWKPEERRDKQVTIGS